MPSAMPRNIQNEPRVTISGGSRSFEMRSAFRPPPAIPDMRAIHAAAGTGKFQSRHAAPNTTAARPIIEPTDRSIPPVMITGVSATASNPSSTLKRRTSTKLLVLKKFCAIVENSATCPSNAPRRIHTPAGTTGMRNRLMLASGSTSRIVDYRSQNDSALNGSFPISTHTKECQRRTDSSKQNDAEHSSSDRSNTSSNRRSAYNDSGNDLHFQPEPAITRNLIKSNRIENGSKAGEKTGNKKYAKNHQ